MQENIFGTVGAGKRRTWLLALPVLLYVLLTAGQLLTVLPALWGGLITKQNLDVYPHLLYFLGVTFAGGLAAVLLWVRYFEGRGLESVGMIFGGRAWRHGGTGYFVGLLMGTVSVLGVWAVGGYNPVAGHRLLDASFGPIILLMLAFCIQSGVEEILFRGWMFERVAARFGLWPGILANASLFTLMHVDNDSLTWPDGAIFFAMTMSFAIFLSLLVVRQRTIWGACGWHAAWNWLFITWYGLPTTGVAVEITPLVVDLSGADGAPDWLTGGAMGPENSVVTTLVLVVACVWMAVAQRRRAKPLTDD